MPFARGPVLTYVGRSQYATVGTTEYVGSDDVITIPSDFGTDLATVPRVFWALIPPQGAYESAAVLHDFGCVALTDGSCLLSSRDVDGLFRRVMREGGVGFINRWIMWCGVRWGALANPARRAGWWRDAPLVVGISAAVLAVTAALSVAADRAVHALVGLLA
jgi:hypothetical protein